MERRAMGIQHTDDARPAIYPIKPHSGAFAVPIVYTPPTLDPRVACLLPMPRHTALYDTLHVAPDADADTLKRSYRKLAVKYHPDKNNGSEEATAAFQTVSRAYEVLSDPEKRKLYDAHGEEGVNQAEAGGGPMNANDIFASMFGGGGGGGDPFESFFGGRRGGGRRRPQQVVSRVKAAVDLKTLVRGGTIQVQFNEAVAKHLMTGQ